MSVKLDQSFHCLVAGKLVPGIQKDVINPATTEHLARYGLASPAMIDEAIASAASAFVIWRDTSLAERRALVGRLADIIRDNGPQLARLLTLEQGKPIAEAQGEVGMSEGLLRYYASMGAPGGEALFDAHAHTHFRTYTPLGIVAGIIPWNFPLAIAVMKLAPALLAGNSIIIKPAPTTPLTTLELGRLIAADCPPGLVQMLGDDGSVGPVLTGHSDIAKVSFTGSTLTGREVMKSGAASLKRLSLELGGNDPAIVLNDVDVESAADAIFKAVFTNCGQVCGAIKRLYIQEEVFDRMATALAGRMAAIVVGDGLDPDTTIGPVQNEKQYIKANELLREAEHAGQIFAQSHIPNRDGFYVAPSLVVGLPDDHPLVAEEQFAPVLPILRFRDETEVVERANATPYGLTASIWSSDKERAERIAQRIDASLVCINRHNENPTGLGMSMAKQSGIGWLLGEENVKEYMQAHLIIR